MTIIAPPKKPGRSTKGLPKLASQAGTPSPTGSMTETPAASAPVPMNFTVEAEFRKRYRLASAEFDMSMIKILQESFELWLERKRGA